MRRLPLYERPPVAAVEACEARAVDHACKRCSLHLGVRSVCIPDELVKGDGDAGTVVLVGESPGVDEDRAGRPFFGASGALLRSLVKRFWKGHVILSNGLRCHPPANREERDQKFTLGEVDACRPFLAHVMREQQPTRIITLGGWAALSVLGRRPPPLSTRRGYGYLYSFAHEDPTPAFIVMHPAAALRNRFLRRWFESDLEWALTCPPPPEPPIGALVGVVETPDDAREALVVIEAQPWTAFDIEARGVPHEDNYRILALSIALPQAVGGVAAFTWTNFAPEVVGRVRAYLGNAAHPKYGQSVAYDDVGVELTLRTRVRGIAGDVRLWRKLLDSHADADLETMAEHVGMGDIKLESEAAIEAAVAPLRNGRRVANLLAARSAEGRTYKPKEKSLADLRAYEKFRADEPELAALMERFPGKADCKRWAFGVLKSNVLVRRNAADAVAAVRLKTYFQRRLDGDPDLTALRHAFVDKVGPAAARIERWGVPVSVEGIRVFDKFLEPQLEPLQAWVDAEGFDPMSHPQVADYLFKKLKLPILKRTKTRLPSVDKEALERLEERSPEVRRIIEYRHIVHMRSTYGLGLLEHIRPDGRIHPHLLPDGAESGRWSCRDPNMQNHKRHDAEPGQLSEGKLSRDCLVAEPGYEFVELDNSQVELRVAAILSRDEYMTKVFREGGDLHMSTARLIARDAWGIPPEEVQKFHRAVVKTFVFGALYGAGDEKLAATVRKEAAAKKVKTDFTREHAARFQVQVFAPMRQLTAWLEAVRDETERTGEARTYWNGRTARRRAVWQVADHDEGRRGHALRAAANNYIQGGASDYCTASLVACIDWIEANDLAREVQLVLPVHDSLLFHVKKERTNQVIEVAAKIMTGWPSGDVPLKVGVQRGPAWGSMEEVKL